MDAFPPRLFEAIWRDFEDRGWAVHHPLAADIAASLAAHDVSRAVDFGGAWWG